MSDDALKQKILDLNARTSDRVRIAGFEDFGDDGGDDGYSLENIPGYGQGDFIRLDGGRTYIRKFEVVGMRWEQYVARDEEGNNETCWCLRVFFSDCPNMVVYGEDAADLLKSFGLPQGTPQRG